MQVYKVFIENNIPISAMTTRVLHHGDVGLKKDREHIQWVALECDDEKTAIEVAAMVVDKIWGKIDD